MVHIAEELDFFILIMYLQYLSTSVLTGLIILSYMYEYTKIYLAKNVQFFTNTNCKN